MAAILAKILEGEVTLRDLEDTSQIDRKQVGCLDNIYLQKKFHSWHFDFNFERTLISSLIAKLWVFWPIKRKQSRLTCM